MLRFFAIMLRFKNFMCKIENDNCKRISYTELKVVEIKYLKYLQGLMFSSEQDSRLLTLSVFIHSDGTIRLKTKIVE